MDSPTLAAALAAYLATLEERGLSRYTINSNRLRVSKFIASRKETAVSDVTRADVAAYIRQLGERGRAEATLAGIQSSIKAFFNWCQREGWVKFNPCDGLRKRSFEAAEIRVATAQQVEQLIAALPEYAAHRYYNLIDIRDALFVSISIDSGGRRGEIANLRKSKVEYALNNGRLTSSGITVYSVPTTGKTGAAQLMFFEETADMFKLWFDRMPIFKKSDWVFINTRNGDRLNVDNAGRSFEKISKFAGLPTNLCSQIMRATNTTAVIREAGDVKAGQLYAGHRDVKTTMRHYNATQREEAENAAAYLARRRRQGVEIDEAAEARVAEADEMAKFFGLDK